MESADDITVVGDAADGREAIAQTRDLAPDVMMMDIQMPEVDGLEATPEVVSLGARVLILTTYDLDENLYRAFRAGAGGFVLKTTHPDDRRHAGLVLETSLSRAGEI